MIAILKEWTMSLIGASIIAAIALTLTPRGRVYGIVRMLCGVVMVIALISPLIDFNLEAYGAGLSQYKEHMYLLENNMDETSERLNRTIIEEECAAYILDKAQVMDLTVTVTVTAKWGDEGYFIPHEVYIISDTPENSRLLSVIEADLGVPRVNIHWSTSESEGENNET